MRADECPRWSAEDLEEFRNHRGDWLYRQECLAEFVDATGQMFRSDDIEAAFEAGELDATDLAPLFGRSGAALPRHRPEVLPPSQHREALPVGGPT